MAQIAVLPSLLWRRSEEITAAGVGDVGGFGQLVHDGLLVELQSDLFEAFWKQIRERFSEVRSVNDVETRPVRSLADLRA
jgi:hypothetical protein